MQLFSVGYSKKGLGGCAQPPRPFLQRSVSGLLSARRPGHIPAGQYMEMQMLYTLPRLLLPMGLAPLGTHIFILGRSRSALRVSPPRCGGETAAQRRRPIFDGGPGEQAPLSPEARSYPGRTVHGNADALHSAPPAPRCWRRCGSCPVPAPWPPWQ